MAHAFLFTMFFNIYPLLDFSSFFHVTRENYFFFILPNQSRPTVGVRLYPLSLSREFPIWQPGYRSSCKPKVNKNNKMLRSNVQCYQRSFYCFLLSVSVFRTLFPPLGATKLEVIRELSKSPMNTHQGARPVLLRPYLRAYCT